MSAVDLASLFTPKTLKLATRTGACPVLTPGAGVAAGQTIGVAGGAAGGGVLGAAGVDVRPEVARVKAVSARPVRRSTAWTRT